MAAILSTNMASLYAQRSMATAQAELSGSVEKLSSGKRINSAKDDAAGLGISQSIAGISNINNQSVRNLQNATSLVQTADGALDVVGKMLQRILTLTTQKNDQALNANQRSSIDAEVTALTDEISRIKDRTKFNGTGSIFGQTYTFGAGAGVTITIEIPDLTTQILGLQNSSVPISAELVNQTDASKFIIQNHGLSDGDIVQYQNLSGNNVGQLVVGQTYTVSNPTNSTTSFQLRDGNQTIILNQLGTVDNDYFLKLPPVNTSISTISGASSSSTDNILVAQGWTSIPNNFPIIFDKNGLNTDVGEFIDGGVYEVADRTNTSLKLRLFGSGINGDTVDFGINSDLSGTSLYRLNSSDTIQAYNTVNANNNPNTLLVTSIYSKLSDGQLIFVSDESDAVTGIQTGAYAVIKGGAIPNNYIQLALVSDRDNPITLTNVTADQTLEIGFQFYDSSVVNNSQVKNLTNTSLPSLNTIQTAQGNLIAGDIVIYTQGANQILGLTNNEPYTVVTANNGAITLRDKNGNLVNLNDPIPNDFTGARFQEVTKITFDSTSQNAVTLASSVLKTVGGLNHGYSTGDSLVYSTSNGTGLAGLNALQPQSTFYAVVVSPTEFKLAMTSVDAAAGNAINNLGIDGGGSQFAKNSTISISSVSEAIRTNASNRAKLGSYLSALSYSIDNLETMSNNLGDAYSRIVDTDFAAETANLTKNKILQEASAAMLAQANQMPNVVLSLLK